jgi:hypothetical protein
MADDPLLPYRRLLDIVETECALAQAGHFEEYLRMRPEHDQAMADLPDQAPVEAADAIRRALAIAALTDLSLEAERDRLAGEIGKAVRRRAVGRAYVPATGGPAPTVIDRAA